MFIIREIVHCKPGKTRPMIERFKTLSNGLQKLGGPAMRLMTDVSGEQFWTIVAEAQVERVQDFFDFEQKLMGDESIRKAMADYHDLVANGRREIYRVES